MEGYLCQFLIGYFNGDGTKPLRIGKDNFFGHILYDQLELVPEDCIFKPTARMERKQALEIEVGTIGTAQRKNPTYYYYLPKSKQLLIEKYVRVLFDELLCSFLINVSEQMENEIKSLIEAFCERYRIDFATYYDTLKKKYYRDRTEKNLMHSCPLKKND